MAEFIGTFMTSYNQTSHLHRFTRYTMYIYRRLEVKILSTSLDMYNCVDPTRYQFDGFG